MTPTEQIFSLRPGADDDMTKSAFLIALLIAVIGCVQERNDINLVENDKLRLSVPEQYLVNPRGWWSESANRFDDDGESVLISVPASQVNGWLPSEAPPFKNEFVVLVSVLSDHELEKTRAANIESSESYAKSKDKFENAVIEPYGGTNFYRVYDFPEWRDRWWLGTRSPQQIKASDVVHVDDIIGLCREDESIGITCGLDFFSTTNLLFSRLGSGLTCEHFSGARIVGVAREHEDRYS